MVEQRVLIPSVQVRVPVPQPFECKYMFKIFLIFCSLVFITAVHGSEESGKNFIRQLLKWNIDYLKLDNIKAGAGCMLENSKSYDALGLS